jgi:hypothetical protein
MQVRRAIPYQHGNDGQFSEGAQSAVQVFASAVMQCHPAFNGVVLAIVYLSSVVPHVLSAVDITAEHGAALATRRIPRLDQVTNCHTRSIDVEPRCLEQTPTS